MQTSRLLADRIKVLITIGAVAMPGVVHLANIYRVSRVFRVISIAGAVYQAKVRQKQAVVEGVNGILDLQNQKQKMRIANMVAKE